MPEHFNRVFDKDAKKKKKILWLVCIVELIIITLYKLLEMRGKKKEYVLIPQKCLVAIFSVYRNFNVANERCTA